MTFFDVGSELIGAVSEAARQSLADEADIPE
jgi:hypothetical protein